MSYEIETNESILQMTIDELDLSVGVFNRLKRNEINTVNDLYRLLDKGIRRCWRKIGKKGLAEILNKVKLLDYPVYKMADKYAVERLDGSNLTPLIEELGLSKEATMLLQFSGINDIDAVVEVWQTNSITAINNMLNSTQSELFAYDFYKIEHITLEIITKLALYGVNVRDGLNEYIESLIDEDAKYSIVRYWRAVRNVLTYLPRGNYSKLKSDKFEQYASNYKHAVQYILKEQGKTCGEILPEEDYVEVICPICSHNQSYFFKDIFKISCGICEAKPISEQNGFYLYTMEECEEKDICLDNLDENIMINDSITDINALFVCKLCNSICGAVNLSRYDYSDLGELAESQACIGCTGESFLLWIADETNNSVEFDGEHVYFKDNESGEAISFSKDKLNPQNLWKKITFGGTKT